MEEREEVRTLVVDLMRGAMNLRVPIEVDAGTGRTWLEAH